MKIFRNIKRSALWVAAFLLWPLQTLAEPVVGSDFESQTLDGRYRAETVASPGGIIWGMAFVDATRLAFTQREGQLGLLDLTSQKVRYLSGAPKVFSKNQGGLLDVALSPDGEWLYFTYAKPVGKGLGATTLARAKLGEVGLKQWKDLLVTRSAGSGGRHFGSRIAFDDQGYVFFSVGDRGERDRAQDLEDHAGTIIRLHLDGSIPTDNPFVNHSKVLPEIWSYGHRNPQGLAYDKANQQLWSIEHGPRGGDEINLIQKAENYGWPVLSYGREYVLPIAVGEGLEREGMVSPSKVYIPSIAPSSLLLYDGRAFPEWQGSLFAGALKLRHLNRVTLDHKGRPKSEFRLLESRQERIRALAQSPEGWLYFSTDSGTIERIRPLP